MFALASAATDLMSLPMRVSVSSTIGTAGELPPRMRSHGVYSRSPAKAGCGNTFAGTCGGGNQSQICLGCAAGLPAAQESIILRRQLSRTGGAIAALAAPAACGLQPAGRQLPQLAPLAENHALCMFLSIKPHMVHARCKRPCSPATENMILYPSTTVKPCGCGMGAATCDHSCSSGPSSARDDARQPSVISRRGAKCGIADPAWLQSHPHHTVAAEVRAVAAQQVVPVRPDLRGGCSNVFASACRGPIWPFDPFDKTAV